MNRRNPLVSEPAPSLPETPDITDELMGEVDGFEGPPAPLAGPQTPPVGDRWPQTHVAQHRLLTVVGLHGGAGTSTVAGFFGEDAVDAGQGWPVASGWQRPLPELSVVAVARSHGTGLAAADEFTRQWAAGALDESRLLGLVIVDDGPRLLDAQSREIKRLLRAVPFGAHLPWNEQWRLQGPDADALPRRVKRICRRFRTLAGTQREN